LFQQVAYQFNVKCANLLFSFAFSVARELNMGPRENLTPAVFNSKVYGELMLELHVLQNARKVRWRLALRTPKWLSRLGTYWNRSRLLQNASCILLLLVVAAMLRLYSGNVAATVLILSIFVVVFLPWVKHVDGLSSTDGSEPAGQSLTGRKKWLLMATSECLGVFISVVSSRVGVAIWEPHQSPIAVAPLTTLGPALTVPRVTTPDNRAEAPTSHPTIGLATETVTGLVREAESFIDQGNLDEARVLASRARDLFNSEKPADLNECPSLDILESRIRLLSNDAVDACKGAAEAYSLSCTQFGPDAVPTLEVGAQWAECMLSDEHWKDAGDLIEKIENSPGFDAISREYWQAAVHLSHIKALYFTGQYKPAAVKANTLISYLDLLQHPDAELRSSAYLMRAMVSLSIDAKDFELPLADLGKAIAFAPGEEKRAEAYTLRGRVNLDCQNFKRAIDDLQQAIALYEKIFGSMSPRLFIPKLKLAEAIIGSKLTLDNVDQAIKLSNKLKLLQHSNESDIMLHADLSLFYVIDNELKRDPEKDANGEFLEALQEIMASKEQISSNLLDMVLDSGDALIGWQLAIHRYADGVASADAAIQMLNSNPSLPDYKSRRSAIVDLKDQCQNGLRLAKNRILNSVTPLQRSFHSADAPHQADGL
jgi:tetratricopeptide (TPR) repeat protein